jgi:hypothetical protein
MKDQLPPEKHNRIINAHLKSGDIDISATDWMASPVFEPLQGNMSAIFVVGEEYDELKAVLKPFPGDGATADQLCSSLARCGFPFLLGSARKGRW